MYDYLSLYGQKCLTCQYWGGNAGFNGHDLDRFMRATGRCYCKGVNNPNYYNGNHLSAADGCNFWEKHFNLK